MSAAGFTSGPWLIHATNRVIVQAQDCFADVTVENGKVVGEEDSMPTSICLLRNPDETFSEDQTLANGFLIAAAPELYAFVQRVADELLQSDDPHTAGLLGAANLLLAKARGEVSQ